jgi:hypothetical protein
MLALSEPSKLPAGIWAQLLEDMVDFITDEKDMVRIEAIAGLSSFLQCVPTETRQDIIPQSELLDSLAAEYKRAVHQSSVDEKEILVS